MPLPFSRKQIKKLGERLAASTEPTDDDLSMLEQVSVSHAAALVIARERLQNLAEEAGIQRIAVTHRVKTSQTIIEKLRRQPHMDLCRMQDVAGIRLVGDFTLRQQDKLVTAIVSRFANEAREPSVKDRRVEPSWGYRAVHVIVMCQDIWVEIQVRTTIQHMWANLMERLADTYGRAIRYGEQPSLPLEQRKRADDVVLRMGRLSELLYQVELVVAGSIALTAEDRSSLRSELISLSQELLTLLT